MRKSDYRFYRGIYNKRIHNELYLASMRYGRNSFAKEKLSNITFDEQYTAAISARVSEFIANSNKNNIIFSSEGLSLLRHDDEIRRLAEILDADNHNIKIIVYLRNRDDYLNSYRRQLYRKKGRNTSDDYWSALYVENDTWLTDYEMLITTYGNIFGNGNIDIIDYDDELRNRGNVIPSFIAALGLEADHWVNSDYSQYWENSTSNVPHGD